VTDNMLDMQSQGREKEQINQERLESHGIMV
jgi:hypothetical protein